MSGAVPSRTGSSPSVRKSSPPRPKPAPASRLVAQSGPASGQEFALEGDELVIGRAADNPVSIPDTSVSRKHALVRKTAEGWAVSDLGSGNGTMLNGEAIADETQLNDGDVITLGDTELRYAGAGAGAGAANEADATADIPGGSASPARRPPVRTARTGGGAAAGSRGRPVRTSRMTEDPEEAKKKRFSKGWEKNLTGLRRAAGLDAALFGRMVTSDNLARADAAVHVAHAFTVHGEHTETDYFAAVDDLLGSGEEETQLGSGHIGTTELTSGLFYGYVVVDVAQLVPHQHRPRPEVTGEAVAARTARAARRCAPRPSR